jgi:hypothetical protein
MGLWWIGNMLLLAVIPVVVKLLQDVLVPVQKIDESSEKILSHGGNIIAGLDGVPQLVTTRDLISQISTQVGQYGTALDKIL